ncbi:MAG: hypothetical protein JHD35_03245, partial [Sphingopyxis sp.]|nr:hypothetical protein [Sphingopyxis sp.]
HRQPSSAIVSHRQPSSAIVSHGQEMYDTEICVNGKPCFSFDPIRHGAPGLRTFLNIANIAELWNLSVEEQMVLLGICDLATFNEWKVRAHDAVAIPMEVIERIGCVLSICGSLVTLFPEERTGTWVRAENTNSTFGGRSALVIMKSGD